MYINFKELRFKNINSYGNKETIFTFKKGLNSISGLNGHGKSSILDALCYCLYGIPFKKIKINELINRTNNKGLWTQVLFSNNENEYIITRTLKPDSLNIKQNNEELDLLSSKKLIQTEIDKILGIDVTLFRQIISLAINYNKPFLSLKTAEKRDIMETIFNIKIFGTMLKSIKEDNLSIKVDSEVNNNTVIMLKRFLSEQDKLISDYTTKKNTFDEDKTKKINILEEKGKTLSLQQKTILNEIKNIKSPKTLSDHNLQDCTKEIGQYDYKILQCKKKISFFENTSICPTCKNDITNEQKKDELGKNKIELNNSIVKKKELEQIVKTINTIETNNKLIEQKRSKISYIQLQQDSLIEQKDIIKKEQFNVNIESMKDDFNEKKNEYIEANTKQININKEQKLNNIIIKILGDEGIKTYFFKKLIPILNEKINEYLNFFKLPITIKFDEYMNEIIDTLQDKNVSYMSFSEGEKKRIDVAVLLSFIETTKLISNWSCNLMIFDELLDSSTDSDGIDKIFNAIKEFIDQDPELCIYIISFRADLNMEFDNKFMITKDNGFSRITLE